MPVKVYNNSVLSRVIGLVTLPIGFYLTGSIAYNEYYRKFGPKRKYLESQLYRDINKEKLSNMSSRRESLVETVRKLVEVVPGAVATTQTIFTENVVWRDPVTTIKGKDNLMDIFRLLPMFVKDVQTATFEVIHYEDHVRIVYDRQVQFTNGSQAHRESSLTLHLQKQDDGEERINELIDEWQDIPILDTSNNAFFGPGISFIRIARTKYTLWNDKLFTKLKNIRNKDTDDESTDLSKYLETPKPKFACK